MMSLIFLLIYKNCVMTTSPDECGAQLSSVYIELTRQVERTGSESQNCVSLVLFLDETKDEKFNLIAQ